MILILTPSFSYDIILLSITFNAPSTICNVDVSKGILSIVKYPFVVNIVLTLSSVYCIISLINLLFILSHDNPFPLFIIDGIVFVITSLLINCSKLIVLLYSSILLILLSWSTILLLVILEKFSNSTIVLLFIFELYSKSFILILFIFELFFNIFNWSCIEDSVPFK